MLFRSPRPSFTCSEPFGQDDGPVTAGDAGEDGGTGVGLPAGTAELEALAGGGLVVVDDDEQAATAARQVSTASARPETAAADRPASGASPRRACGLRAAECSIRGNTLVPPIRAALPASLSNYVGQAGPPTGAAPSSAAPVRQARRLAPRPAARHQLAVPSATIPALVQRWSMRRQRRVLVVSGGPGRITVW